MPDDMMNPKISIELLKAIIATNQSLALCNNDIVIINRQVIDSLLVIEAEEDEEDE